VLPLQDEDEDTVPAVPTSISIAFSPTTKKRSNVCYQTNAQLLTFLMVKRLHQS
jgi:hypothetical protein